jgi:hypothetical protein
MQTQVGSFLASGGAAVQVSNANVIRPN